MRNRRPLLFLAAGLIATLPLSSTALADLSTADLGQFIGSWTCAGQSVRGKAIGGQTTFEWALDEKWIEVRHQDNPPGDYKVDSWWGRDGTTKQLVGTIFDSMGTVRHYVLSAAARGKITLNNTATSGYIDRFVYEPQENDRYQVTYYRKSADQWKKVDSSICRRNAGT